MVRGQGFQLFFTKELARGQDRSLQSSAPEIIGDQGGSAIAISATIPTTLPPKSSKISSSSSSSGESDSEEQWSDSTEDSEYKEEQKIRDRDGDAAATRFSQEKARMHVVVLLFSLVKKRHKGFFSFRAGQTSK